MRTEPAFTSSVAVPSEKDLEGGWEDGYGFFCGPSMPCLAIKKKYGSLTAKITEEFGPSYGSDYVVEINPGFKTMKEAKAFCELLAVRRRKR